MLAVGDQVVFVDDGSRGTIVGRNEDRYQVTWDDGFTSWERQDALSKLERTKDQE